MPTAKALDFFTSTCDEPLDRLESSSFFIGFAAATNILSEIGIRKAFLPDASATFLRLSTPSQKAKEEVFSCLKTSSYSKSQL